MKMVSARKYYVVLLQFMLIPSGVAEEVRRHGARY